MPRNKNVLGLFFYKLAKGEANTYTDKGARKIYLMRLSQKTRRKKWQPFITAQHSHTAVA